MIEVNNNNSSGGLYGQGGREGKQGGKYMAILKNIAYILLVIFIEVIFYVYIGIGVLLGSLLILLIIVFIRTELKKKIKSN